MKTKRQLTNRILSLVLTFVMVIAMLPLSSLTALAADATYDLWVGGEQFTSEKLTIEDSNGGTAKFDPVSNTLTLTNYNYKGEGYDVYKKEEYAAIYYEGSDTLNLVLEGTSSVTQQSTSKIETSYGIFSVNGSITVSGNGSSLTVTGGSADDRSCGVYIGGDEFIVSGGKLTANSGTANNDSWGLYACGVINISDGTIEANSGSADESVAMQADIDVTVSGGSITATGGNAKSNSYGILVYYNITVLDGNIEAIGGDAGSESYGVDTFENIAVSGGTVKATAGTASTSIGMRCLSSITISDTGSLTAKGSDATGSYSRNYGVEAYDGITVLGGRLEAVGESYGVYNEFSGITISGGETVAQGKTKAFHSKPIVDSAFKYAAVWAGTDEFSAIMAGERPIDYLGFLYSHNYVKIAEGTPTATYTVETYTMGTDGKYGEPVTETKTAAVDSAVSVTPENKQGFDVNAGDSILNGTVAEDGSTVLKVYYTRNQYPVTFYAGEGTFASGRTEITIDVYFGAIPTAPETPALAGCTFTRWEPVLAPVTVEGATYWAQFCAHIKSEHTTATDNTDGTHSFTCTVCGGTATEEHTLIYSVNKDGDTITAFCYANCGHEATATVSATGKTYDGKALEATVNYSDNWTGNNDLAITYEVKDGEKLTEAPKNAGDYIASITLDGQTASTEYTIEKAVPTANDFVFSAPTDLIYDGNDKNATVTVKDGIVGMGKLNVKYFRYASGMWIDNQRAPHYPGKYKVGIYLTEGDNYNAVYSNDRIWLGDEFEIKYLETSAEAAVSGTKGTNGWYTSAVTLSAPDGYTISASIYDDAYGESLTFANEQNETVTYYLRNTTSGEVAQKTLALKIDLKDPTAQYSIKGNGWREFVNFITFGIFCKDNADLEIKAADDMSAVTVEYKISNTELTAEDITDWNAYTGTVALNPKAKNYIYIRITDDAGRTVVYESGVVVFTDCTEVSIEYYKDTDNSVAAQITFNGNTVKEVKHDNTLLTNEQYTVTDEGITFAADYLDTFAASDTPYTFTVSYHPMGVEMGADAEGDTPANTTISLTVKKQSGSVTNISDIGKEYDGSAVSEPTYTSLSTGKATFEYKLKGADDSTYTTTAPSGAGTYIVRVTVAADDNYEEANATAEFTIDRATLNVSVQQNGKLTYDGGKALTPTVSENAVAVNNQQVSFTYSTEENGIYGTMPSFEKAGTYTVYFKASAPNHNEASGHFTVTVDKATVNEPTISSKVYTGAPQTADVPASELYTVEENNGGTGVQESGKGYNVVLKLTDSANYKWSTTDEAEVTLSFKITRATNEWKQTPSIEGWTYGETAKAPVYEAKFGEVTVSYSGTSFDGTDWSGETAPTKAGSYTATFTVDETPDYSGLSEQVSFTIAKKPVTVTADDASKTYGDSDPVLTYTHTELVGSDALAIAVTRASGENVNTYTITASQAEGANPNYDITFKTGTFTIHKAALTVTVEDKTVTYGDAVPTYTVKYDGFVSGDDKDDLGGTPAFDCDYAQFSNKGEYTVKASGYTSGNYTISYVDGKLTVNAKPITVTIQNATSIYGEALAELKATDNGIVNGDKDVYSLATVATSTSNVGKYAITGTALDDNYDITFANEADAYEITKREITITAEAKNTIVNTALPTYTYKVEGLVGEDKLVTEPTLTSDADITVIGEYDITATGADAGDNYSIKYAPAKLTVLTDDAVDAAAGYVEELKDYDPATVTSEDKAELDEILDEINTILDDENITDNGKKALEEVKEQVEKLIKEITDAAEATDTENTEKVKDVTAENVTPENKTDLEKAKEDLEKALDEHGSNMTEDEKKTIEDEIKRIDDALEVIGNVEAVEELIDKLPDTIKKDDEAAIQAAEDAYNALSDYEKSLVDADAKKALDDAKAALAELKKSADPNSPATGDNSNMFLWIALLFISGGAVITLTVVDRKRRTAAKK